MNSVRYQNMSKFVSSLYLLHFSSQIHLKYTRYIGEYITQGLQERVWEYALGNPRRERFKVKTINKKQTKRSQEFCLVDHEADQLKDI